LFPGVLASCETAAEICWDENPWSLGAQQVGELPHDLVTRVEGRVHFAGAHTSETGWMEGALESGYRVAAEILPKAQDSKWYDAVAPEGLRL
jgi:monoamine oxidase